MEKLGECRDNICISDTGIESNRIFLPSGKMVYTFRFPQRIRGVKNGE